MNGRAPRIARIGALCLALIALSQLRACSSETRREPSDWGVLTQEEEIGYGRSQFAAAIQIHGGEYRLSPDLNAYVDRIGQGLAAASSRPQLPWTFVVLDNSTPNAWVLPGGKVAITRGLLATLHSEAELAAILSHLIIHAEGRHNLNQVESQLMTNMGPAAATIGGGDALVTGNAALAATLSNTRYREAEELVADEQGMRLMERAGYDARSALQLEEAQLAMSENPQIDLKWRRGLFAYHPPLPSRIKVATNTLQELPPGQLQNEQVFERAMAPLKRESPAYDAFDRGVMALAEGDAEVALKYARNAIAIALERESASFYALEALALIALGQEPAALRALNVAVDRNPDYYAHLLQRGLLKQSQGDLDGASTDLERSIALLPTQSAFHALGEIAMERGQNDIATGLFQTSAEAGGPLGRESEQLMVATDVERWLPAVLGINAQGMLEVAVGNRSRLNFSACEVQIFERREGKEVPVTRVTVAPLPSGFYSPRTETGLGPLQAVQLERFRARVASTSQTD